MTQTFPQKFYKIGREFLWILIGQGAASVGAFVGIRILTDHATPESYGIFSLGLTLSTLLQLVIFSPFGAAASRFYSVSLEQKQVGAFLQIIKSLLLKGLYISAAVFFPVLIGLIRLGSAETVFLGIISLMFSILSGFSASIESILNAARQRIVIAWHKGLEQPLRYLLATLFVLSLGDSSYNIMGGFLLTSLGIFVSETYFLRRYVLQNTQNSSGSSNKLGEDWQKQITDYAQPYALWGIFYWFFSSSDRWALQLFGNAEIVGIYAVANQLGYGSMMLVAGLGSRLVEPIVFGWAGSAQDETRVKLAKKGILYLVCCLSLLTILVVTPLFFFHKEVFGLLVGSKFQQASWLLPLTVLYGGIYAIAQTLETIVLLTLKSQKLLSLKISTSCIGSLLNFFGAWALGLRGVILAVLFFAVIHLMGILLIVTNMKVNLQSGK